MDETCSKVGHPSIRGGARHISSSRTHDRSMTESYAKRLRPVLTPTESKILRKLSSPHKIQDFIDTLPVNLEPDGATCMSPRRVLKTRRAHCFEGALLAAAACAYHGGRPLLLDFQAAYDDEDHVVALFQENG